MAEHRNEPGRAGKHVGEPLAARLNGFRLHSPFRPPKPIVLDIEQQALERPIQARPNLLVAGGEPVEGAGALAERPLARR